MNELTDDGESEMKLMNDVGTTGVYRNVSSLREFVTCNFITVTFLGRATCEPPR